MLSVFLLLNLPLDDPDNKKRRKKTHYEHQAGRFRKLFQQKIFCEKHRELKVRDFDQFLHHYHKEHYYGSYTCRIGKCADSLYGANGMYTKDIRNHFRLWHEHIFNFTF